MEPLVLTDKNTIPTDELVFSIIGQNKLLWQQIFKNVHDKYPDVDASWNYYSDGKNWLLKTVRKKKTLFWTALHADSFRITFYFGDKAETVIENSGISDQLIENFRNGKHYGKIRAISIKVFNKQDVENVLKLVDIKSKI
jgi:hypothetical protein